MITNYLWGIIVEYYAMLFLKLKAYKILYHRYKTYVGELDLITYKNDSLIFIEVKYRSNQDIINYAIQPQQIKRICRAAELFISHHPIYANCNIRFDVLLINRLSINHIQNVW